MAATGVISRTCQACGTPISVQPWGTVPAACPFTPCSTPYPTRPESESRHDQLGQRAVHLGFRRPTASDPGGPVLSRPACPPGRAPVRDFAAYLDAMQFVMDSEATLGSLDLDETTAAFDLALSERAPGSLRLMTEVQMAWIDRQSQAR